ncbi:unnamed protein product [Closterium sp. Naga37s-1]|nr:unnamed protein product [Closterium sp. Naga37s-1]
MRFSLICASLSSALLSNLRFSLICASFSSALLSHLRFFLICASFSSALLSHLRFSLICASLSSALLSHLPFSLICASLSSALLSHLRFSLICASFSSALLSHLRFFLICASLSSALLSHLRFFLICASFSSALFSHLSFFLICASFSSGLLSHLRFFLICASSSHHTRARTWLICCPAPSGTSSSASCCYRQPVPPPLSWRNKELLFERHLRGEQSAACHLCKLELKFSVARAVTITFENKLLIINLSLPPTLKRLSIEADELEFNCKGASPLSLDSLTLSGRMQLILLSTIAPTVELIVRHGWPLENVDAEWCRLRCLGIGVEGWGSGGERIRPATVEERVRNSCVVETIRLPFIKSRKLEVTRLPFIRAPELECIFFPTRQCEPELLVSLQGQFSSLTLYRIVGRSFHWEGEREKRSKQPVEQERLLNPSLSFFFPHSSTLLPLQIFPTDFMKALQRAFGEEWCAAFDIRPEVQSLFLPFPHTFLSVQISRTGFIEALQRAFGEEWFGDLEAAWCAAFDILEGMASCGMAEKGGRKVVPPAALEMLEKMQQQQL